MLPSHEMSREEALAWIEKRWWEGLDARTIALAQLRQPRLCMPFHDFQKAVEEAAGCPVWTHEFAQPEVLIKLIEERPEPEVAQAEPVESPEEKAWKADFQMLSWDDKIHVITSLEKRLVKAGLPLPKWGGKDTEALGLAHLDDHVGYAWAVKKLTGAVGARPFSPLELSENVGIALHELEQMVLTTRWSTEKAEPLRQTLLEIRPLYTKLVEQLAQAHEEESCPEPSK